MPRVTLDLSIDEIERLLFQLPPEELLNLVKRLEERVETVGMMRLSETSLQEWNEGSEDIYEDAVNDTELQAAAGTGPVGEDPFLPEDFGALEIAWLQRNQDRLAAEYPGEWIAVEGKELVAHASTLSDLLRQAAERGHPHPFVTAVPEDPSREFFG